MARKKSATNRKVGPREPAGERVKRDKAGYGPASGRGHSGDLVGSRRAVRKLKPSGVREDAATRVKRDKAARSGVSGRGVRRSRRSDAKDDPVA